MLIDIGTGCVMKLEAPAAGLDSPPNGRVLANAKTLGTADEQLAIASVVARGPRGALALAALSVGVVVALWVAFYLFVFLPRGAIG